MPTLDRVDHDRFSLHAHGRFYDYLVLHRGVGVGPGAWEQSLRTWNALYQNDRWQVLRNPAPAQWPEPTPQELAQERETARLAVLPPAAPPPPPPPSEPGPLSWLLPSLDSLPAFDAPPAPLPQGTTLNMATDSTIPMLRPLFGPEMQLQIRPHVPKSTAPTASR